MEFTTSARTIETCVHRGVWAYTDLHPHVRDISGTPEENNRPIMARKIRDSRLESRSARLRLPVQKKPYTGPSLARGIGLLYRRNAGAGSWVVKATDGHGATWTKAFAVADDFEDADGGHVLSYSQASDIARRLARGRDVPRRTTSRRAGMAPTSANGSTPAGAFHFGRLMSGWPPTSKRFFGQGHKPNPPPLP